MRDSSKVSPENLAAALATAEDALGENAATTRTFVTMQNHRLAHARDGGPGVTLETLVVDLVSVLSGLEVRIYNLENGQR